MTMIAPREEILQAIKEAVCLPSVEVAESTHLKDLALDSIDYVEILVVLNTRFQVPLDPMPMSGIETVGDLITYVTAHQGEAAGRAFLERF